MLASQAFKQPSPSVIVSVDVDSDDAPADNADVAAIEPV
jgi:hypothetical protein